MHSMVGTPCRIVTRLNLIRSCKETGTRKKYRHAGINRSYTWPPWSNMFDDSHVKNNGTSVGVLSAGATAIATYFLMRRGMLGSIKETPSIGQPDKIDNFAQLAKSLAPG